MLPESDCGVFAKTSELGSFSAAARALGFFARHGVEAYRTAGAPPRRGVDKPHEPETGPYGARQDHPQVERWFRSIDAPPAAGLAVEDVKSVAPPKFTAEQGLILFGQNA